MFINNTLSSLGVTGTALKWFSSYLSCHSQKVIVNGAVSTPMSLTCGVPQGSVGGPTINLFDKVAIFVSETFR